MNNSPSPIESLAAFAIAFAAGVATTLLVRAYGQYMKSGNLKGQYFC